MNTSNPLRSLTYRVVIPHRDIVGRVALADTAGLTRLYPHYPTVQKRPFADGRVFGFPTKN
ncbi:MAG: hypothetical protein R3C44_22310 [Chloroflexota bacterium]